MEPSASTWTAAAAAIDKQDEANAVDEEDIWCAAAAATIDAEEQANKYVCVCPGLRLRGFKL